MYEETINAGYGLAKAAAGKFTTGKTFYVVADASANFNLMAQLWRHDKSGLRRRYATITLALAACVAGRGDRIVLAPDFVTAPTAAELLSAETKGVSIIPNGGAQSLRDGVYFENRATAALPQTTNAPIFTITGKVKLLSIIGEVMTVIQNQANNTKLTAVPTLGNSVDICAVLDIANLAVGGQLFITGTFATAMQKTTNGAYVYQATPVVLLAGTLNLNCAASNTGAVKWRAEYEPIDPGAQMVFA